MAGLYKRILVPLDGSDLAAKALPHGQEIAELSDAQLVLFQAVDDEMGRILLAPAGLGTGGEGGATGATGLGAVTMLPDESEHTRAMDQARRDMNEKVQHLKHQGVNAVAGIDAGDPAERIVDYAAENKVDLIVMSTHGRTGLARWAYGSVAQKVLQAAPCPVLIIRSHTK